MIYFIKSGGYYRLADLSVQPPASGTATINGVALQAFTRVDDITELVDCFLLSAKDYIGVWEALSQRVSDIGSGNVNDGVDDLIANDEPAARLVVQCAIGRALQRSTLYPNTYTQEYITNVHTEKWNAAMSARYAAFRNSNADFDSCNPDLIQFGELDTVTDIV